MRNFFYRTICIALLIVSHSVSAQITLVDTAVSNEPAAISFSDLGDKMILVKEKVKNITRKLNAESSYLKIDTLLPPYIEFIKEQKSAYNQFKNSHPNKEKVINLINKWGSYDAFLNIWQENINTSLGKNGLWLDEINPLIEEWTLTYNQAKSKNPPFEVMNSIRQTQKELKTIEKAIKKRNNKLLRLETKILIQKESISSVVDELMEWKQSEEFNVFYQRHPAFWNLRKETNKKGKSSKDQGFSTISAYKNGAQGTLNYLRSPENETLKLLILLLLISIWFWRLKKVFVELHIPEVEKSLIQSKNVIINHLTPSLLFTWAIICILYFTHTPSMLSQIILVIALIATLPLFKTYTHPKFNGITIYVILFYLLNITKSYVWYSSLFYSGYLLIETLLLLGLVFKMTYPYMRTRELKMDSFSQFLVRVSPIYYLLLLVAFISNLLGYTNLTDLMLKVAIEGAVLVLVFSGIRKVLGSLLLGTVYYYLTTVTHVEVSYRFLLEKRARQLVHIFSYTFIAVYFLHIIDVYNEVMESVYDSLSEPILAGGVSFTVGSILSFFAILIVSFSITSFIEKVIDEGALNFMNLPKGIPSVVSVVIRYFFIAFAFVIALSTVGVSLSKFNLLAGALGLGIGFGLQNIISNFVSGLILIFERPIQTDDVVEVGTLLGKVKKIGVRSSNVRTFDGAEVVVPNSNLIANEVINWTLSDNVKRIEIKIGVAYGSDLTQVIETLTEAIQEYPQVLKDPEPSVLFNEFGDSSLNFRVLYWIPVEYGIASKSAISIAIYNKLKEAGITIPFPQRDVHVIQDTPPMGVVLPTKDKDA